MFGRMPGQEGNHFHLLILDRAVRPNTTKKKRKRRRLNEMQTDNNPTISAAHACNCCLMSMCTL